RPRAPPCPYTTLFRSRLALEAAGLYLDFSNQPWTLADLELGLALARAAGVESAREAQFAGETMNRSENRAALHAALRAPPGAGFAAQGRAVSPEVEATREAMAAFVGRVRSGELKGADRKST